MTIKVEVAKESRKVRRLGYRYRAQCTISGDVYYGAGLTLREALDHLCDMLRELRVCE
jgi:hypothetical protein